MAALLGRSNGAEAHGTVHYNSNTGVPAIHGDSTFFGDGVLGSGNTGMDVLGNSSTAGGVKGMGNAGVVGFGVDTTGVRARTTEYGTGRSGRKDEPQLPKQMVVGSIPVARSGYEFCPRLPSEAPSVESRPRGAAPQAARHAVLPVTGKWLRETVGYPDRAARFPIRM